MQVSNGEPSRSVKSSNSTPCAPAAHLVPKKRQKVDDGEDMIKELLQETGRAFNSLVGIESSKRVEDDVFGKMIANSMMPVPAGLAKEELKISLHQAV